MAITRKIMIIELIIAVILGVYFLASLLLILPYVSIGIFSIEARFWFLNLTTSVVLSFFLMAIHWIIRDHSLHQVMANLKWKKLKEVELCNIFIIGGVIVIVVPVLIFMYLVIFLPDIEQFFIIVQIFIYIGVALSIIGVCMLIRTNQDKSRPGAE